MQAVTKQTLGLFWRHSFKYKWQFYVIWFAIIATTVLYTYEPVVIRNLMDSLTPGTQPLSSAERFWLIVLIALAVSNQVIWRVVGFSHNSYQPRYISDLLVTCYQKLLGHSLPFFTNNFVGSLVARVRRFASAGETIDDKYKFDLFRVFVQWVCVQIFVFTTLPNHLEFGVIVFFWSILYAGFAYWFSNYKLRFDIAAADQETKTTAHLADTHD